MKSILATVLTAAYLVLGTSPAATAADPRREVHFPAPAGYEIMACDLHTHTVFSDGAVWPTVRVHEAWRLGLDAVVISDHIEYQPHAEDIPTKHNRAYELAAGDAAWYGIVFPRGSEITRGTPPGHFNAIFLQDQSQLDVKSFTDAIQIANEQKAFVFWNHQAWKGEEQGSWRDVHSEIFDKGWLHGMEVANGGTYYPSAHQWCLDKGLTMLGNSDIHTPDLREVSTADSHRTMTLAFVKETSTEGLKEALFAGRTVVWNDEVLIGGEKLLSDLFNTSVHIAPAHRRNGDQRAHRISNLSDLDLKLVRTGKQGPRQLTLPARRTIILGVKQATTQLEYQATNLWMAPEKALPVTLRFP